MFSKSASANANAESRAPEEVNIFLRIARWIVGFISICIPVLLAFTGALGVKQVNDSKDTSNSAASIIFIGIYMIVFAATLFIYEILKLLPDSISAYTDSIFKKNFGFLYGPYGRGFYTLMIGVFAFGLILKEPAGLGVSTAVVVGFWGCFIALLNLCIPSFFPKETKYIPN